MRITVERATQNGANSGNLRTIGRADQSNAAKALALAFTEYNVMQHVFPDDASRTTRLERLYAGCVAAGLQGGGVAISEASDESGVPLGAVVWLGAGEFPVRPVRLVRTGMILTPLRIGFGAFSRLESHEGGAEKEIARMYAGRKMGYLWLLGTTPSGRGNGLGRRLVEFTCEQIRTAGHEVCVLKTDTTENVRLYEHLGFRVTGSGTGASDGIDYWILEREL